ncbi:MAG: patatin-like phospholipase family protein [Spirochaetaceae bacterium]
MKTGIDRIVSTIKHGIGEKKVGLALGGGAARGIAHVGVLKVLEAHGVDIDYVAGTSAGSLIGALYCSGYTWQQIRDIVADVNWGDLVQPALFSSKGLVNPSKLEKLLDKLISKKTFEELSIPLNVVAVDLLTGELYIFREGSVARAVRASSSIPGMFSPLEWNGMVLIDGGVKNNVPADIVKDMGADIVIAVDVNANAIKPEGPENVFDVMMYSMRIMLDDEERIEKYADFLIRPDLEGYSYYNLRNAEALIDLGEAAAREQIGRIMAAVH